MSQKKQIAVLALVVALMALPGCASTVENTATQTQASAAQTDGQLVFKQTMELEYAKNFSVDHYQGGYAMIEIGNTGAQYLLVPEGKSVPDELDASVEVLQMPLNNTYISSTGMLSLIDAIGAMDHVKLVSREVDKWYVQEVVDRMNDGRILYCGHYAEPDYEMIVDNETQLYVDNTNLDSQPEVVEKFLQMNIPTIIERSSLESHPLARVEWVKLFGVLFDREEQAETFFAEQKALVETAVEAQPTGKTVAMGYITSSGKYYVRNSGDYNAQMIEMAGGKYNMAELNPDETGNTQITEEEWYVRNKDADCLFYVNIYQKFNSLQDMIDYNPLFAEFKSVQEGNVWITSPNFTQSTASIAGIITDMNTILSSEDGDVTTDHLIKLS